MSLFERLPEGRMCYGFNHSWPSAGRRSTKRRLEIPFQPSSFFVSTVAVLLLSTACVSAETVAEVIERISLAKKQIDTASFVVNFEMKQDAELARAMAAQHQGARAVGDCAGTSKVQQKDVLVRYSTTIKETGADGAISNRQDLALVAQDYSFFLTVGSPYGHQLDHLDPRTPDPGADVLLRSAHIYPDVLACAFGGLMDLPSLYSKSADHQWIVKETRDSDGAAYILEIHGSNNGHEIVWGAFTVRPEKGFTVSEVVSYSADGHPTIHIKVGVKQAASGLWFPEVIDVDGPGTSSQHVAISDVHLNDEMKDESFTIEGLNLPDKQQIVRKRVDGTYQHLVVLGGKPIPADVVYQMDRANADLAKLPPDLLDSRDRGASGSADFATVPQDLPPVPHKVAHPNIFSRWLALSTASAVVLLVLSIPKLRVFVKLRLGGKS